MATGLLPRLRTMSLTAFKSDGLNDQDIERGTLQKHPPLSFIPRVEKEIEGFIPPTRKNTFSELLEEKVVIFTGTTPQAYVQLQDTYEGLLRKKCYREQYDKSEVVLKEAENRLGIHIKTRPSQSNEANIACPKMSLTKNWQKLARLELLPFAKSRKRKSSKPSNRA